MATIVLPPRRPAIARAYEGLAQGPESRYLEAQVEKVLRHWNEPADLVQGDAEEPHELAYRSVPLEKVLTVRVKYRSRGELKPTRYTFDD
jgi:hypothetical protein